MSARGNVVRRRGRPNRGGGNKRGGRGGGGPRHNNRGRGRGGGSFSRKQNDYDFDDLPVTSNLQYDDYEQTSYSRQNNKPRVKTRVAMQRLHMSSENQEMVRDMLTQLHGEQFEVTRDDGYEELDWRAENQYWMTDSKLKIEDSEANTFESDVDFEQAQYDRFNQLALNKLQRYGFDKSRCAKALSKNDGDIGLSLEYLLSNSFDLPWKSPDPCDPDMLLEKELDEESEDDNESVTNEEEIEEDVDWHEIYEQRADEKLALESIYAEKFKERVANHVWVINVDLPKLTQLSQEKIAGDKKAKRKRLYNYSDKNICHFYLKGNCMFGSRCKYKHQVQYEETENSSKVDDHDVSDFEYKLEIRFPSGNKYPLDCPFVAFQSTNILLPQYVCLNITAKLIAEAKEQSGGGLPILFTLVSILESEDEITSLFNQAPSKYSLPEPIISRKQIRSEQKKYNEESNSHMRHSFEDTLREVDKTKSVKPVKDQTAYRETDDNSMDEMTTKHEQLHEKYARKDTIAKKVSQRELEQTNLKLKAEFKKKKQKEEYERMLHQRKKLPSWDMAKKILSLLKQNQVIVISGMTGCGKTTQIPQFILDHFLDVPGIQLCNIICTQPRRISAIAVADRVSQERLDKVGNIVGYQIRLESMMSSKTRLLFCTAGILLRRLEVDSHLQGVTHIIVDEVHERSEESDFLMMILRDLLPRRPDMRVILMSATINATLFSGYFDNCPILDIPGRTFPVDQYFLEDAVELTDYIIEEQSSYARPLKKQNAVRYESKHSHRATIDEIEDALQDVNIGNKPARDNVQDQNLTVNQLFLRYPDHKKKTIKNLAIMDHEKINLELIETLIDWIISGQHHYPRDGAILVFLPGYAEIQNMFDQLQTSSVTGGKNKYKFKIIPLHSTLSSEDQRAVFLKPKEGVTKIVLATNIAETSITIDDIVFVIDAGRMKEKRYDPSKGMESLDTVWVSRANALQRQGRAGRVAAGVCFHLFTGHRFDFHLRNEPIPEIMRVPLEQTVLRIKILPLFRNNQVEKVLSQLIQSPSTDSIQSAIKRLQDLGALDENKELTPLGFHLAALPVDVRIGKLMLFGAIFRCLDPALTIAASLSFKSPFVAPFGKKGEATAKKHELAIGNSDHLTMVRAYKGWLEAEKNGSYSGYSYCQEYFLSIKSLQMLASMKRQFVVLLSDIGFIKSGLSNKDLERLARHGGDGVYAGSGEEANTNNENYKLVAAILVAALYPNVVQVFSPENKFQLSSAGAIPKAPKADELKFKTKVDGYVNIHPSSVNFQVRYYESPYLVFHEKVKTSKVFIRDCSMVSVYPLLLFGGGITIDLDRGNFVMSVDDGWIRFIAASHQIAELVKELRLELDQLLKDKIEKPSMDLCTCPRGNRIISTIVKLITTQ